jgi:hypothetical protein
MNTPFLERAMKVIAAILTGIAWLLLFLGLGAGILAVMPARGGEALLAFAGKCVRGSLALGMVATLLNLVSVWRAHLRKDRVVFRLLWSAVSVFAALSSGVLLFIAAGFEQSGKRDLEKVAREKAEHSRELTPAEIARAKPMAADALAQEWKKNHAESDRAHEHEVLKLTGWVAEGPDYFVNGGNCISLRSERIVCCMSESQERLSASADTKVTLMGRYASTHYQSVDKSNGKLILDGCRVVP